MDLWAHRAGGWRELARGSSRTSDGPAVYDLESNRLFVLGLVDVDFHDNPANWVYDPTSNRWLKRDLGDRPAAAAFVAYDSESDRAILFDGDAKTWAYDLNTDNWIQKAPKAAPPVRSWFAISYDQGQDRVVLFGGLADKDLSDTWTYDDNTDRWKEISPAKSPPADIIRLWRTTRVRVERSFLAVLRGMETARRPCATRGPTTSRRTYGRSCHLQPARAR